MSRVRALAPVLRFSVPDTPPYHCARCGHVLWFGALWWEHRAPAGRVLARVHRICVREPAPGFPGYAVREVGA